MPSTVCEKIVSTGGSSTVRFWISGAITFPSSVCTAVNSSATSKAGHNQNEERTEGPDRAARDARQHAGEVAASEIVLRLRDEMLRPGLAGQHVAEALGLLAEFPREPHHLIDQDRTPEEHRDRDHDEEGEKDHAERHAGPEPEDAAVPLGRTVQHGREEDRREN